MAIQIAMMASKRAHPYAQESLKSMFERDELDGVLVRVVAGASDPEFLGPWKDDERVTVDLLDEETFQTYSSYPVCRRISETFFRCLLPAAAAGDDLVLLQDDVLCAHNWLKTTRVVFAEARRRLLLRLQNPAAPVILALFSPQKYRGVDRPLAPYKPSRFYANIGLLFSANTLPGLIELTKLRMGDMDDMIVKECILRGGANLLAVNPSVIQHVGDASTHSCSYIRSPTFEECGHK